MKQVNWNGKDVLLVEVPSGVEIKKSKNGSLLYSFDKGRKWYAYGWYKFGSPEDILSEFDFAFASPLSPTEEEASNLVEDVSDEVMTGVERINDTFYRNYIDSNFAHDNSIESLHSRIRSEGFEQPERVVVLIKK